MPVLNPASDIAYLIKALEILVNAPTAGDFGARMKSEFADREQHGWIDLSTSQLYSAGRSEASLASYLALPARSAKRRRNLCDLSRHHRASSARLWVQLLQNLTS